MKTILYKTNKNVSSFYFCILILACFFLTMHTKAIAQDTLFIYKSNVIINKQAIEDIDSILFYDVADGTYSDTIYMYQGADLANQQAIADLDSISFSKKEFAPLVPVYDGDDNEYDVVKIGSQVWMSENLKTTKYNNGDPIPNGTANDSIPGYTWYESDDFKEIRGALYNYPAVATENLCPTDFRVASKEDWELLIQFMELEGYAADSVASPLKSVEGWQRDDGGINAYGFNARAGGYCTNGGGYTRYSIEGYWWTSTEFTSSFAYRMRMGNRHETNNQEVNITVTTLDNGFSVRCIRND